MQLEKSAMEEMYQLKEEIVAVKEQEISVKHKALLDAQKQLVIQADECLSLRDALKMKNRFRALKMSFRDNS